MIALIRKDLGWLLIFLVLGLVQFITLLVGRHFDTLWVMPDCAPFMDLHRLSSLAGLAFGVFAAIREEISRTEEYVRHRPVGPLRLYWVKVMGCILVMLAWLVIPTFLSLARGFWSDNAQLTRYSMILKYMGTGVVAFSSFGVGLYAGTLRLSLIKRIIIGILSYVSLMYLSYVLTMQTLNEGATSLFVYVCIHLTTFALMLYAGCRNIVPAYDLDRPEVERTVRLAGTITVFFVTIIFGSWISDQQDYVHNNLLNEYPSILRSSEPKLIYSDRNLRRNSKFLEVNERHEPTGEFDYPKNEDGRQYFPHNWQLGTTHNSVFKYHRFPYSNTNSKFIFGEEVSYFDQGWKCIHNLDYSTYLYLYRPEGMIYYYRHFNRYHSRENFTGPIAMKLGKGSSNDCFSQDISLVSHTLPRDILMIADKKDGGIWYCNLNKGDDHFRQIDLPNGDKFRGHAYFHKRPFKDLDNVFEGKPGPHPMTYFVVEGDKGTYAWNGNEFVEIFIDFYDFNKKITASNRTWRGKHVYRELDPISPEVAIMDDESKVIFTHRYGLHNEKEIRLGLKLYAYSILRSPAIQMISYFGFSKPRSSFRSEFLIDPLLASGKRFWLLATNLLLSGCLAFLAVWRLIRFNAERNRLIYWGILVFLSGIGGYLVYRLFETKRAYRVSPVVRPEEAPPMVIQSA